jgi:putative flippase GtrA
LKLSPESPDSKNLLEVAWQFIKFSVVGLSNTLISHGICYFFIFLNRDFIYLGETVGFLVSVLNAYYWNNRYVFRQSGADSKKSRKDHAKALLRVYTAYGSTFLLGLGLTWILKDKAGVSEWIIPVILIAVFTPVNFVINKFWAFRSKKSECES